MQNKCKSLEDKVTRLEENLNSLDQYGRRNNSVLSGKPECVADVLEATVTSILADIDVDVDSNLNEQLNQEKPYSNLQIGSNATKLCLAEKK